MFFSTDKQTINDLQLQAVYNLFNRTITRGGAIVLEEMFQAPLPGYGAICQRSNSIRSLWQAGVNFPFSAAWFDAIEPYLANTDERTRLENLPALKHRLLQDGDTQAIIRGITALLDLLHTAREFFLQLPAYPDTHGIMAILDSLPALPGRDRLSNQDATTYDGVLRFKHRNSIQQLLRYIYILDAYSAVAKVATEKSFSFPEPVATASTLLQLEDVYHPLLKNAVVNSISVNRDNNVIFLTGANMAGKSTFMKTIGISLFLAHMGFPVPAKKMVFGVLDGIFSTINLPDNLGMGASHFYAEVLRVKKIAQELKASKKLLVIFDELFRGTNVKDAHEATIAIVKGFARKQNSIFIVSTHIIEAAAVLKTSCENISYVYLPTRMQDNHPVYTYRLEQGVTDDRHGMIIIKNEGILDILAKNKPQ